MTNATPTRKVETHATKTYAPNSLNFALENGRCPLQPCGACEELAKLDATKVTSQNFLNLIHKRHHLKSNYLNLWHDRLASRLPVEIVSQIFIFFDRINVPRGREVSDMTPYEHRNWDHLLRTPALLSRVCRRWRNIVLGTPQLWTKFSFNVFTQARNLDVLKEFLSRSGSLPLSLKLWGDTIEEELESTPLDPIADLIRSYSCRWKFLDVKYVPEGFTYKVLHDLEYIPPSVLEGLLVDYFDLSERIPLREPLRLRHLCIIDMDDLGKIPLEWDNITHLQMSNIPTSTLLHIVKQTPRLTNWISDDVISLIDILEGPLYPLPVTPIIIPTLEHLELTFKDNDTDFFSHLTLPAVTHLKCHFGDDPEFNWDLEFDDLIDFLARSQLDSKTLQTFDLSFKLVGMDDYDHRFIELTSVTHLSIDIDRQNTFVDPCLSGMSDISILPRLRKLEIRVPRMPASSWSLLCDVFRGHLLPVSDGSIGTSDSITVTSQEAPRQFYKRPLEDVSVHVYGRKSTIMPREDYLFIREIQKTGVVKLEFEDRFIGVNYFRREDILQRMALMWR